MDREDYERVDLPRQRLRNRQPVWIQFVPEAWPDRRLEARIFWNPTERRFHIRVDLQNYGPIIPWSPVELDQPLLFRDYFRVIFHDPTGQSARVRPRNLGNPVDMTLWPGPENPAYEPYEVGPDDPYDAENPPEPWMPPLGYAATAPLW